MRLPRRQEKSSGGMRLTRGWQKNIYPRSSRLPDHLADLEREDPEAAKRGGVPTFTSEEMQDRRPPGRR
jgi:hypothetical protein